MEKLTRYLEGRKKGEFAAQVGISSAFLSQILNGQRSPGYKTMLRIEAATEGFVDLHSWQHSEAPTGGGK